MVPVTFGHPWRSCCFCLEKCPGLWLLVVSLGGVTKAWTPGPSQTFIPGRASIIPGPVGLNGGPRHRRSEPGGAATRALRLVTDPARHPARRARVRECRAGSSVLDACYVILQHSSLRSEAKKFLILLLGIHISQITKRSVLKAFSYTYTSTIYRSLSRAPCINLWNRIVKQWDFT